MSKIDDGGTAFPTEYNDRGLTMRDYFAGQYLVGKYWGSGDSAGCYVNADELARDAYMVADAMLAERRSA